MKDLRQILNDYNIVFSEQSDDRIVLNKCFNCPGEKKLGIRTDNGVFNCFKCGVKGNAVKLLSELLNISIYDAIGFVMEPKEARSLSFENELLDLDQKQSVHAFPTPISLPMFFKSSDSISSECRDYLQKRGYLDSDIKTLDIHDWKLAKRVVFPVTFEGEIYGYIARTYSDEYELKVTNSKGNFRSHFPWNLDNVDNNPDEIVICEGTTSAVKCGVLRSVALMGKTANSRQLDKILALKPKRIVLSLDIGTDIEQRNIYEYIISKSNIPVHVVKFDPIKSLKCLHCKKKIEINVSSVPNNCPNCGQSLQSEGFRSLLKESEYKDAGDHTHQEMDLKIKQASEFCSGPSSWI